ncbi:hypothetical protein [Chenggangzhangella methanolivorans]|uniref:Uncharacterized protein n=1 Tax=Chenggangzhangella methanolivorans TaxID=1437009 RepID=A0A9E6R8Z2_9HYPH|nr:hypothetical protein [Chenggangzhangella methanolivorans]QZN99504.1 hypothetical protein K6K41_22790 [Chenggangzhangella methanolivorans]
MTLEHQQKLARRNPCFAPEDCANTAFGWRLPAPFDDASVMLTLNVGME